MDQVRPSHAKQESTRTASEGGSRGATPACSRPCTCAALYARTGAKPVASSSAPITQELMRTYYGKGGGAWRHGPLLRPP